MDINELSRQIENLEQYMADLLSQSPASRDVVISELSDALEELRVAEEELRQQQEELQLNQLMLAAERQRYHDLFEFAPDGYIVTDADGSILEANRMASTLLGVPQKFLIGKPFITFVAQENRSAFRAKLLELSQGDRLQEWEVQLKPRDREPLDVSLTVVAVQDSQGQLTSLRWSLRDITDRKQAEGQILALNAELMQEAWFEETLNHITDKVRASLDESQILQTVIQELTKAINLSGCDIGLYDIPSQTCTIFYEYSTLNFPIVFPQEKGSVWMKNFPEGYHQLLQRQEFQFCEITSDPMQSQVSIFACPIVAHQEVLGGLWCFSLPHQALNIAQVRLVQQVANQCAIALEQARLYKAAQTQVKELAKLNDLKDQFLSNVSHELRTPLTNIKMALHLLQIGTTEKQRSRCLSVLQSQCDREINLITDLLDLQHLENEKDPAFLLESINLPEWLPIILAPFQQRFQTKQQKFTLDLSPPLPAIVAEHSRLRRILIELLQNAHKFTPVGGEIVLAIHYNPQVASTTFTLRNQAEIPAAELPHIFEKFYRSNQENNLGGTGLGLALVKQLVERLRGLISVESQNGWTTFTVQVPNQPQLCVNSAAVFDRV